MIELALTLAAGFFLLCVGGAIVVFILAFLGNIIFGIFEFFGDGHPNKNADLQMLQNTPAPPQFWFFRIKTWETRKREYKQGQEPIWFDKLNLWLEGNNEKNK